MKTEGAPAIASCRSRSPGEPETEPQYLGHLSIPNDDLRALCEVWLAKKGARPMPGRSDFDPGDIPGRLWPAVMMLDVCREDFRTRFRYRRVGMRFVDAFGRDPTDLFLDDVLPLSRDGETVDMALVGHAFDYDLPRLRTMRRDAPALVREIVAEDGSGPAGTHPAQRSD